MREYIDKLDYRPRKCVWELTLACNASCLHCGSYAGRPRDVELNPSQAVRVARDLAGLGCDHVTLSGGEPLLRPDWPTITETLAGAGVTVAMISNGLAFDAHEAQRAKDAGLAHIAFSVDGLEAVHDRMRGRAGFFGKTTGAIATSVAAGIPTCAITHINRWNIDQLDEMHARLGSLGVRSWQVQLTDPVGAMSDHREVCLRPRDLLHLVPLLIGIKRRGLPFVEVSDSIGYFGPFEQELRATWQKQLPFWTGCYAGCRQLGLESGGNVKGCLALPSQRHGTTDFIEGNVLRSDLADIWRRRGAFAYNREFVPSRLTGFCRTCPYGAICRAGCHSAALAFGGTLTENRWCYYRVAALEAAARPGPRRWVVQGLAPAAIVAALGVTSCYDSFQSYSEEEAGGPDAAVDTPAPPADVAVDAAPDAASDAAEEGDAACPTPEEICAAIMCDVTIEIPPGCPDAEPCTVLTYGVFPPYDCPDASSDVADASEAEVPCPTAEEACCFCRYAGPLPVPEGCPDPCIVDAYGVPPPVPSGSDPDSEPEPEPDPE
jgi:radical SAM protein with 4Fe4S-binding SPASM domain